jgi:hypothetical protein
MKSGCFRSYLACRLPLVRCSSYSFWGRKAGDLMARRRLTKDERGRRAWCQDKAVALLYTLENGRRSFDDILARIRRRWPVSTAGDDFQAKLWRIFEREQVTRRAWSAEQARRWFKLRDPRWSFERLLVYIQNRRPALVKNPHFLAELRRLYDTDAAG